MLERHGNRHNTGGSADVSDGASQYEDWLVGIQDGADPKPYDPVDELLQIVVENKMNNDFFDCYDIIEYINACYMRGISKEQLAVVRSCATQLSHALQQLDEVKNGFNISDDEYSEIGALESFRDFCEGRVAQAFQSLEDAIKGLKPNY